MTSSKSFRSSRRFELWDYRVSFQQALIRSPATPELDTNIDLTFWGVEFLKIPQSLNGIELVASAALCVPIHLSNNCQVFTLTSEGTEFVIAAIKCQIFENTLDIFDSSLIDIHGEKPSSDLGRTLANF